MFSGIGSLPKPATESHVVNRGRRLPQSWSPPFRPKTAPRREVRAQDHFHSIQYSVFSNSHMNLNVSERLIWVCVFITAGPFTKLCAWGRRRVEDMCYEIRRAEACVDWVPVRNPVLLHRVRLFSLVPLGNRTQNSRVAGARPNHQPIGGSDPNHQGIWSPPGRGWDP